MNRDKVLIVIPAYNEEKNICRVVDELRKNYSEFDYVVVNDGSKDKTVQLCYENNYCVIDLQVNLGLAGAVQTGMKYAYTNNYGYAVQFDADGQHLPEYICKLKEQIDEGNDIVIGSRFVKEKKPCTMRMLGSNMISFAIKLSTGKVIKDPTSGMRIYNRKMIEKFANSLNFGPEPDTISHLVHNGVKVSEVQVEMKERIAGESYLNFYKSIMYMIRMFCSILIIQNFRGKERR